MTITLVHALAGVFVSAVVLLILVLVAARSTRPVHPVRCVHCWMYRKAETILSFAEEKGRWGICPDCVEFYWHFTSERQLQNDPQHGETGESSSRMGLLN